VQDWSTWSALRFNTPGPLYRWLQINGNHWQTWTTSGLRLQTAINLNAHMGLNNNSDVHVGGTLDGLGETYCDRCTRGGPALRRSRGFYPWFGFGADPRRMLAPSMFVNFGFADEGRTRTLSANPTVALRFSTAVQGRIGSNLARNDTDAQWVDNFVIGGVTHHAFARLEQRTVSLNLRLNYTAAPDVTLELYAEPFVSTGKYTDLREVSATPGARNYEDRFVPFTPPAGFESGFRFRRLRGNALARWEYRPGSTIFLVWAHGREASDGDSPRRSWTDEYRDLFDLHADNTFLIKVAYWFNR
jgi:hypothetical protein